MATDDKSRIDPNTITDKVIDCLKFAVKCTKDAGGILEIGIKGHVFNDAGYAPSQRDILVRKGYLSRQMIFAEVYDSQKCSLAGEQGARNISGMYFAVTAAGLEFYKTLPEELNQKSA